MGLPTFYDKLLQVPILNLSIKGHRSIARPGAGARPDCARPMRWRRASGISPTSRSGRSCSRRSAPPAEWATTIPGSGCRSGRQACADGRPHACRYVADVQAAFCDQGSGWACNARARAQAPGGAQRARHRRSPTMPIVLRGSKGPVGERSPAGLTALACRQGWPHACSAPMPRDRSEADRHARAISSDCPASARTARPCPTSRGTSCCPSANVRSRPLARRDPSLAW